MKIEPPWPLGEGKVDRAALAGPAVLAGAKAWRAKTRRPTDAIVIAAAATIATAESDLGSGLSALVSAAILARNSGDISPPRASSARRTCCSSGVIRQPPASWPDGAKRARGGSSDVRRPRSSRAPARPRRWEGPGGSRASKPGDDEARADRGLRRDPAFRPKSDQTSLRLKT